MVGGSVLAGPSLFGNSLAIQVPGVVHHELEISIIIDGHRDIVVVFTPFFRSDVSISSVFVALHVTEGIFEGIKELG
jgi:hypothetical protein